MKVVCQRQSVEQSTQFVTGSLILGESESRLVFDVVFVRVASQAAGSRHESLKLN